MKYLILFISLLALGSCSVQQRKYQPGFHVSWKNRPSTPVTKIQEKKYTHTPSLNSQVLTIPTTVQIVHASVSAQQPDIYPSYKPLAAITATDINCDDIIYKDGTEVYGKVIEISITEVKYKKCGNLDGPLYTVRKSELFMIKYANGQREVFKTQEPAYVPNQYTPATNRPKITEPYAVTSLIFAILGIWPLTFIGSILAVIFAGVSLKRFKTKPDLYKGRDIAVAGKIIGIVVISIVLVVIFFTLLFLI